MFRFSFFFMKSICEHLFEIVSDWGVGMGVNEVIVCHRTDNTFGTDFRQFLCDSNDK